MQLTRVRTTDSIWGFSVFGSFGDEYREEITINYQYDDSSLRMNTDGNKDSIFLQVMFSPQILDVKRQPSTSLLTAIAKIGGLFALLRFSVILNLWHHSLFVKKMNILQGAKLVKSTAAKISLNNSMSMDESSLVDGCDKAIV